VAALLQRQLEGKYEILEKIKEGGMGAVYKVRHRFLDEIRVIKVIRSTLEPSQEISDRFLREARMAIRLRHPSVAVLHDFAVDDDGKAFIVMEHIAGLTLEDVLRSGGPPPLGLALEIASQALRALGYLHRNGFVHRDVAPDNLMLTRGVDGEPLVKLIDLGIAKVLAGEGAATTTGIFLGKPRYASPEQFRAQEIDHRSDLYSFGVVFYELLTGRCPVDGNDPASYMAGHLFRPPLDFAVSDPHGRLPAELRRIVLRTLAKDPAERFPSAADCARELAPLQDRFPVQPGDLEAALRPSLEKTALWSAPPPAGSSQVLLDRQFLAGTTPTPAAPGGSHLRWDPGLLAPEALAAAAAPPAAAASEVAPPVATASPAGVSQSAAASLSPAAPVAPPQPNPALDETLPLTARGRKPVAPPATPPRPEPSLAARTLAGVPPAQPPGQEAGELALPAARSAAAARGSEAWEARPLHRTGSPGDVGSAGGGAPTLGFQRAAASPPSSAAGEAWSRAQRTGGRSWAWVTGALLLVAGTLGAGAWWYLHPRTSAAQATSVPAVAAPRRDLGPTATGLASAGGPAKAVGQAQAAGLAKTSGPELTAGPAGVAGQVQAHGMGPKAPEPGAAAPIPAARPASPVARAAPSPPPPAVRAGPPPATVGGERPAAPAPGARQRSAAARASASPGSGSGADRAAAPLPAPEPPGPGGEAAEAVEIPDAIYPAAARGTGREPRVLLAVLVDEHGRVAEVRVKEGDSSGLGFDEAAVAAAWRARFLPATRNGAPVRSWSELMIDFVNPSRH
jgi:eukaryotic-like serine/threonine-protein kinase